MAALEVVLGDWFLLMLWPAISFFIVAFGYLVSEPRIFGKSNSGTLALLNTLVLLPFLVIQYASWYLLRWFRKSQAFQQLTDNIWIGRRLASRELPNDIEHIVDLTCEFNEPIGLRTRSYFSFQILDAHVPTFDQLHRWVKKVMSLEGIVYIHCAEGHGRTALFAAAVLLEKQLCDNSIEALAFVAFKRPGAKPNETQTRFLRNYYQIYFGDGTS